MLAKHKWNIICIASNVLLQGCSVPSLVSIIILTEAASLIIQIDFSKSSNTRQKL